MAFKVYVLLKWLSTEQLEQSVCTVRFYYSTCLLKSIPTALTYDKHTNVYINHLRLLRLLLFSESKGQCQSLHSLSKLLNDLDSMKLVESPSTVS